MLKRSPKIVVWPAMPFNLADPSMSPKAIATRDHCTKYAESMASHIQMPSDALAISWKSCQMKDSISPGEFGPGVAKLMIPLPVWYRIDPGKLRIMSINNYVFNCFFMVN
jgi:hypothetical protein